MKFEYAYELVAVVFLVSVAVSYWSKNWIALRANVIFNVLLSVSVVFTFLDVLAHIIYMGVGEQYVTIRYILSEISCLALVGTFALFFVYFLALTGHLQSYGNIKFLLSMVPAVLIVVLILTTSGSHFLFFYDEAHVYHKGPGDILFLAITYGYSLAMCVLAFLSPSFIKRRDAFLCLILCLVHFGILVLQYTVLQNRYLITFYFSDFMVVVFYLLFQNMDRFSDRMSGGFSRSGFRRVVREKYRYRQRFGGLFISIQNYRNLSGVCDEEEIYEIMGRIGSILRLYGGRHNQFHIHGSDFVVLKKTEEELMELYQYVSKELPETIRLNDRNISINYGYYILTMEEAGYEESEFFKMMSSMKKQLNKQTDSRKLMRYEGEIQQEVNLELYIGHKLKDILKRERCELRFFPVMNASAKKCHALETSIYLVRENGRAISEEAIWSVARDLGYVKELGRVVMESTMECVTQEQVLQRGIRKIAINVTPLHVSAASNVNSYKELAQKYHFPLDRFCMELTEDMSVSYEIMKEQLNDLNASGVSLILDRYGENVCNLQGIMQMPFSTVKVSGQMVQRYCCGESDILEYQIKMLRENGWDICLDGIDNEVQYQKVKDLGVDYFQGMYFSHPLAPEQLHYVEDDYDIADSL